ncbi:TonB-dependent receptor [Phenylobacterium sp.]|uniref:TonB-dependent receptor n=1 Tax=Phenylobacterium sp. TaxID=1871053 RepID=UPI002F3E512E
MTFSATAARPSLRRSLFAAAGALSLILAAPAHAGTNDAEAAGQATQPASAKPAPGTPAPAKPAAKTKAVSEVVVTGSRINLMGIAETASQGSITQEELQLRPVYRVGQLLETTPGLVVTVHSGEGKAQQYLVRGFNLDHGTDIANFVDDMPVNRSTNTHGQGYSDANFMMPEVTNGLDYTKGPYYAAVGDFGAVVSTHVKLADEIPNQMSATLGTLGVYNGFIGGTYHIDDRDRVLGGFYLGHVDGPFDHPDNFRKIDGVVRYSHGQTDDGYDLTAMYYKGQGNMTTDQPLRAIREGLISRFGTLDPSDGSYSERISLSSHFAAKGDAGDGASWRFTANAYAIRWRMFLFNDFTHFLDDPVNGDQEKQDETRTTLGGASAFRLLKAFGDISTDTTVGVQLRYDDAYVDRRHTDHRQVLPTCSEEQPDGPAIQIPATNGACNADRVHLLDLGPYIENTTYWTSWLRTIVGLREEYYRATDHSFISGFSGAESQTLFQPKGSIVFGPFYQTELYLSAGRGFHSDDVRGVFGTVPLEGVPGAAGRTPLLAAATGEELGIRTNLIPNVAVQLSVFQEDFRSELTYNADAGQDEASAPSRRRGVEVSAQYKPLEWLELNTDLAFSRARYTGDLTAFDLAQPFIANAPTFIGSFGVLVDNLGPWFGGLQWRALGKYPINDGEEFPQDKGYSEFNADIGYRVSPKLRLQLSVFNLTNTKADAAAYFYAARLKGEPAEGIPDFQVHPLEPISVQFKATAYF